MFGKTFKTLKEARAHLEKVGGEEYHPDGRKVRKLSKKLFPRHTKLYLVGTYMDWLNFG